MPQQMTIQAIRTTELGKMIVILVDEASARGSVIRTARSLLLPYKLERNADEYKIYISRDELWMEKREMPVD